MKIFQLLLCLAIITGSFSCSKKNPIVDIETDLGVITVELFEDKAPITVTNFLEYVERGMYEEGMFYRVVTMDNQPNNDVKIEVIQGGLGFSDDVEQLDSIPMETTVETGLKHLNGTLSMARSTPGSASSEFFICINDQPELDFNRLRNPDKQGFSAFGKVIKGMDVVLDIQRSSSKDQYLDPVIDIIRMSKRP